MVAVGFILSLLELRMDFLRPPSEFPLTRYVRMQFSDILRCFKNAEYVMCDQEMVLFLTDDEFEE